MSFDFSKNKGYNVVFREQGGAGIGRRIGRRQNKRSLKEMYEEASRGEQYEIVVFIGGGNHSCNRSNLEAAQGEAEDLINDAYDYLKGADNKASLRGPQLRHVVMDECAYIEEGIWEQIIWGQGWKVLSSGA